MAQSGLEDFWQNNAECSFPGCDSGEVRICGNVCVTPIESGELCSQDDCASNSLCEAGTGCVWTFSELRCQPIGFALTLFSDCSSDPEACPHDTFCLDFDLCTTAPELGQRCAVGVPQGFTCDSEWDEPGCAPCMVGMKCVGDAGNKKCRLPCEDAGDCPCGDISAVNGCNPEDGLCYRCRDTGESCNENTLCCDEGTFCGPLSGICCPEIGSSCSRDQDCCDEHICRSNGTCNACIADFQACTDSDDCCSELCVSGECRPDCTEKVGDPCLIQNQDGECAKGVVTCVNYQEGCNQLNDPVSETCDDKDNDCDGKTDEGLQNYASCSNAHPPECQSGFTTTGKKTCEDGEDVCNATLGTDYCNACDDPNCGWCSTNPAECSSSSQCAPGARCLYDSMAGHDRCMDDPSCNTVVSCWTPSQKGTCP